MAFQIIRNDITKVHADAIVNTANPYVAIGDGVDAAIYQAAGRDQLLAAREKIGILRPGQVGVTEAFNLQAKIIIHASGPAWMGGNRDEQKLLRQCYDKSLAEALAHDCKSLAFPLLATGTYGFPKELGIQIAIDSFTDFLEDHEMEIYLVVFGKNAVNISGKLVDEVKSYITDFYVEDALAEEYKHDGYPMYEAEPSFDKCSSSPMETPEPVSALPRFNRRLSAPKYESISSLPDEVDSDYDIESDEENLGYSVKSSMSCSDMPEESLDDLLKGMYTDSFEKHLQQIINKKRLKNSEVYVAANIQKQYFSKLMKGQVKPSKEKILALAIGLRLNLDETIDFLKLAGYALSPVSQTDLIVEYFIRHEEYSVMKIDFVLYDNGLDPLS